jgi:hypothetical protein
MFDWDNFFVSAMSAILKSKEIAYSKLIQTTKGISPEGFIPAIQTRDRTEPPIGA